MPKLKIEIEMDNDAFNYPYFEDEVSRIFEDLSERLGYLSERNPLIIHDVNGNKVGNATIE